MKAIIFTLLLLFLSAAVNAQWEPDIRISNNSAASWDPSLAVYGQNVNVVWRDFRDAIWELYYKRSTDAGVTWGQEIRLTDHAYVSYNSCQTIVCSSPSLVHLVWSGNPGGNYNIYYKRSSDAGADWGSDIMLTNTSSLSENPSVCVSSTVIHVVWYDNRDGNNEIYYKRSTDAGITWGVDVRLTSNLSPSTRPSVSAAGLMVNVVWEDSRDGNPEIYFKHSTDAGITWGADTRLTNDPATSLTNYNYAWCVGSNANSVHVVWYDNRDGNQEIYYKRSADGGNTWGTDTRLTNNSAFSGYPSISVSGLNIHVVWYDARDVNQEEYYKRSTDGGITWGADTRLTNNSAVSEHSSVLISGPVVHVVWEDQRDGNWEIYYKRNPTGNPIGIINISSEIPSAFKLYQNYPNPFNPSTKFKFDLSSETNVKIEIYDLSGKKLETVENEFLKAGSYEAAWDAANYSSGIYYYQLTTDNFSQNKKMIVLK